MASGVLALWLLFTPASEWIAVESVVAVVDDDLVLASELDRRIAVSERALAQIADPDARARVQADLRQISLLALVNELVIAQEAARIQVEVGDAEVDAAIAAIKAHNGIDDATLERAIAESGQTMAEYRAEIRRTLLRMRLFTILFRDRITISDADVEAAYRAEKARQPNLGDLAAESERLRAVLFEQAMNREADRWLLEARGRLRIEVRG